MKKLILLIISLGFSQLAISEVSLPPAAAISPGQLLNNKIRQPILNSLNGSQLALYQIHEKYYFIPSPKPDWEKFKQDIVNECQEHPDSHIGTVKLAVQYYSEEIKNELITKSGLKDLTEAKLLTVPFYGFSVFIESEDNTISLYSDIDNPALLLRGETLPQDGHILSDEDYRISKSCAVLKEISEKKKFHLILHAIGHKYTVDSATAISSLIKSTKIKANIDNNESEIDKTTTKLTGKGSGFGIKIGPVEFGSSKSGFKTTIQNENYRVVNREWVKSQIQDNMSNIDISIICQTSSCSEDDSISRITEYILQGASKQKAKIEILSDKSMELSIGNLKQPVQILNINDELKATLDSLMKSSTDEEGEVSIGKLNVKAKKKNDNSLTVNGKTEWTRNGDDWIPTTFDAYLLDTSKFNDRIKTSYSRVFLQAPIATVYKPNQATTGSPSGFIRNKYAQRLTSLEETLSNYMGRKWKNLTKKRKEYTVYTNKTPYPIDVAVIGSSTSNFCRSRAWVDNIQVAFNGDHNKKWHKWCSVIFTVPPGSKYKVEISANHKDFKRDGELISWAELRP